MRKVTLFRKKIDKGGDEQKRRVGGM